MTQTIFTASWGYDETNFNVYREIERRGSFVKVLPLNSLYAVDADDLCAGSKVKIIKKPIPKFWETTPESRAEIAEKLRFEWDEKKDDAYTWKKWEQFFGKELLKSAPILEIKKTSRVNRDKFSFRWELSDGTTLTSEEEDFAIEIVYPLLRRKLQGCGSSQWITIDRVRTAFAEQKSDEELAAHLERIAERHHRNAYLGR